MEIRFAQNTDVDLLLLYDTHIASGEMENAVSRRRVYLAEEDGRLAGWLRYSLFWDNTPFMNLLYVLEEHRGKGYGRRLVEFWEREMARQGYPTLMTSTQSNEYAQHFYVRLGYDAAGGFRLPGEPYELILAKRLL